MRQKGFTLIELMVAITLIGILAMIAVPQAKYLAARARCSEAVIAIRTYERMQASYYTAMGEVGSLDDMGLQMPENGWFTYTIEEGTVASLRSGGGVVVAAKKDDGTSGGAGKVDLCHIPPGDPGNARVISVGDPSYDAHLAHGDKPAPCDSNEEEEEDAFGYQMPLVLIVATVNREIAYNCRVNDAVFSEWTPLDIVRGDANSGSCTEYMSNFVK